MSLALYGIFTLHPGTPNNQFFYGCFNWMIPNHYIKKWWEITKHPFKKWLFGVPGLCWLIFVISHTWNPKQPFINGCLGETTIFYIKIWNHPSETTIYRWLFGVPGINITIICSFVPFCFQVYFGGRGRTSCFRDLHALDTSSHTWCRGAWESWRGTRRWYRDN